MQMEINPTDIIKLVLQFLKENNLVYSMKVLEDESKVKLNTVESLEHFKSDIINGKWDVVLKTIDKLEVNQETLVDLYEEILHDLKANDDVEVAKMLLSNISKSIQKNEVTKLESILLTNKNRNLNSINEKRMKLAENLSKEVVEDNPNQLNFLIKQGIENLCRNKQIEDVSNYDIITGRTKNKDEEIPSIVDMSKLIGTYNTNEETSSYIREVSKQLNFGSTTYIEVAKFSPDGAYLATGSSDGLIEIWDPQTANLKEELNYQQEEVLLFHKSSVTSLNFTKDSKMLSSGDIEGNIKVFKVSNGKCLREFPSAHSKGVTCLLFTKDNSNVISGSFDTSIRVFGLKLGKLLSELSGHTSFINDLQINWTTDRLYSASSDGTVRVWNIKHYELINTITPPSIINTIDTAINNIMLHHSNPDLIFICNKSNTVYLMNTKGSVVGYYSTERNKALVYAAMSHDGEWLYACDEENTLFTFSIKDNVTRNFMKVHEKDVIGIVHHPSLPMLVSYGLDGFLNIYK